MAEINYSKHSGGSSTHIPLNISLIKYFNIRGVLELGAGFRSTHMFADHVEYLTSIETNKDFIDRVRENLELKENHKIVHYDMSFDKSVDRFTIPSKVSEETKKHSADFALQNKTPDHTMLFVDQICGTRSHTLQKLHHKFDVTTFHDAQHNSYEYYTFEPSKDYYYFEDKSFNVSTGFVISKKLDFNFIEFKKIFTEELQKFSPKTKENIIFKNLDTQLSMV